MEIPTFSRRRDNWWLGSFLVRVCHLTLNNNKTPLKRKKIMHPTSPYKYIELRHSHVNKNNISLFKIIIYKKTKIKIMCTISNMIEEGRRNKSKQRIPHYRRRKENKEKIFKFKKRKHKLNKGGGCSGNKRM